MYRAADFLDRQMYLERDAAVVSDPMSFGLTHIDGNVE